MGGVEHERRDAAGGETGCVVRADLLLHATAGRGEHHGAQRRRIVDAVGQVEVGREIDRSARDRDVLKHLMAPFASVFVPQLSSTKHPLIQFGTNSELYHLDRWRGLRGG